MQLSPGMNTRCRLLSLAGSRLACCCAAQPVVVLPPVMADTGAVDLLLRGHQSRVSWLAVHGSRRAKALRDCGRLWG